MSNITFLLCILTLITRLYGKQDMEEPTIVHEIKLGRTSCDVPQQEKNKDLVEGLKESCYYYRLPHFSNNPMILKHDVLLCIGVVDSLYRFNEIHSNATPDPEKSNVLEHSKLPIKEFCQEMIKVYKKIKLPVATGDTKLWLEEYNKYITTEELCTDLCSHLGKLSPHCEAILSLNSKYLSLTNASQTSDTSTKVSVPEAQNPLESESPVVETKNSGTKKTKNVSGEIQNEKHVEHQQDNESSTSEKTNLERVDKDSMPTALPPLPPTSSVFPIKDSDFSDQLTDVLETYSSSGNPTDKENREPVDQIPPQNIGDGEQNKRKISENDEDSSRILGIGEITDETQDSNFFTYIIIMSGLCLIVYLAFHHKKKIVALALEGRRRSGGRSRGGRPSSASYKKLHSNLEEAIASNTTAPSSTNLLF